MALGEWQRKEYCILLKDCMVRSRRVMLQSCAAADDRHRMPSRLMCFGARVEVQCKLDAQSTRPKMEGWTGSGWQGRAGLVGVGPWVTRADEGP